jgi:hypothetical protein
MRNELLWYLKSEKMKNEFLKMKEENVEIILKNIMKKLENI